MLTGILKSEFANTEKVLCGYTVPQHTYPQDTVPVVCTETTRWPEAVIKCLPQIFVYLLLDTVSR